MKNTKKTADEIAAEKKAIELAMIRDTPAPGMFMIDNKRKEIALEAFYFGIAHERQKVQEVMYSIEFAIKYLESTGIQDEKHKDEPEHQMLMDLKQSFEFYNKQRGEE